MSPLISACIQAWNRARLRRALAARRWAALDGRLLEALASLTPLEAWSALARVAADAPVEALERALLALSPARLRAELRRARLSPPPAEGEGLILLRAWSRSTGPGATPLHEAERRLGSLLDAGVDAGAPFGPRRWSLASYALATDDRDLEAALAARSPAADWLRADASGLSPRQWEALTHPDRTATTTPPELAAVERAALDPFNDLAPLHAAVKNAARSAGARIQRIWVTGEWSQERELRYSIGSPSTEPEAETGVLRLGLGERVWATWRGRDALAGAGDALSIRELEGRLGEAIAGRPGPGATGNTGTPRAVRILGVSREAGFEEIRRAYVAGMKASHPDCRSG